MTTKKVKPPGDEPKPSEPKRKAPRGNEATRARNAAEMAQRKLARAVYGACLAATDLASAQQKNVAADQAVKDASAAADAAAKEALDALNRHLATKETPVVEPVVEPMAAVAPAV